MGKVDSVTLIHVVVYGVSGHQNDANSRIWYRVYYIENKTVKFKAALYISNHQIKGRET